MTIADTPIPDKAAGHTWTERAGKAFGRIPKPLLLGIALLLAAAAGIGLGILIGREGERNKDQLWIENLTAEERGIASSSPAAVSTAPVGTTQAAAAAAAVPGYVPPAASAPVDGIVVASKTGEVYYLPTCASAKRITPEKLVTFSSRAEAEKAGYRAAKNCKGL